MIGGLTSTRCGFSHRLDTLGIISTSVRCDFGRSIGSLSLAPNYAIYLCRLMHCQYNEVVDRRFVDKYSLNTVNRPTFFENRLRNIDNDNI